MPEITVVCMKVKDCSDHPDKCSTCVNNRRRKTPQYKKA